MVGISYGFSAISACGNHADPWWSGSDRGWHETAFATTEYSPKSARPSFRRTGAVKPCGVSKEDKLSVPSAHFDASPSLRSHKGKGTYSPTINCSSKWGEDFFPHSHYSTREKPTRAEHTPPFLWSNSPCQCVGFPVFAPTACRAASRNSTSNSSGVLLGFSKLGRT